MLETIDYNGEGDWSCEAILSRYTRYCRELGIDEVDLSPTKITSINCIWIYPVMDKVIERIECGDEACKRIGIEFIEQDQHFPFGKILKSNTARALRRISLTDDDKNRIRKRLVQMLIVGNVPHEYKQYVKLLKKIGFESYKAELDAKIIRSNLYVMRYYNYLIQE